MDGERGKEKWQDDGQANGYIFEREWQLTRREKKNNAE